MLTLRSADGTSIAYETWGSGPALVVVNGALSDRTAFGPMRALLQDHYTLVVYDRRGRGDSGDTAPYAPARELEDLAAVIAATGGPSFVFGHSSGGILALRAAMHRVPIRRLAVNEPPFILPGTRPVPPPDITRRLSQLVGAGNREEALRTFLLEQVALPPPAFEQLRASLFWPRMLSMAHTVRYDSELSADWSLPTEALGKLTLSTLVLNGTASFAWLAETARALVRALPDARGQPLEGQPHSPAPAVLAPVLRDFFK